MAHSGEYHLVDILPCLTSPVWTLDEAFRSDLQCAELSGVVQKERLDMTRLELDHLRVINNDARGNDGKRVKGFLPMLLGWPALLSHDVHDLGCKAMNSSKKVKLNNSSHCLHTVHCFNRKISGPTFTTSSSNVSSSLSI